MDHGVRLAYKYHDIDVVELQVTAWNGRFGGSTKLYVGQGELADVATSIDGFPNGPKDVRELTLGAFGAQYAGGAIRLRFHCIDYAGHARLELSIESDRGHVKVLETATMHGSVEAAAVDRFVSELRVLNRNLHGSAMLSFLNV